MVCRKRLKSETPIEPPPQSPTPSYRKNHYTQAESLEEPEEKQVDETYGMYAVHTETHEPFIMDVCINDVPIKMEFDTGAISVDSDFKNVPRHARKMKRRRTSASRPIQGNVSKYKVQPL